jgi:hypothetical protein
LTLPRAINYALRFPAELRTNDEYLSKLGGLFFNWMTNFKLSDGFTVGVRNKDDNDGGNPTGYVSVMNFE